MQCPACRTENPSDSKFCKECSSPLTPVKESPGADLATFIRPNKEPVAGTTFSGRYQIIEELGQGGMGKVYKVFDTKIREKVALKLIRPELALEADVLERFNHEMKLARKIGHRNVCRMFDLGEADGVHFLTMEYVSGVDLKTMIHMSGSLGVGTVLSIGKQIADGLAEAHSLGIVHRDLKPQNIMIDKHGNVKIMDFGIARSTREKGVTGSGVMIGTPEYMSPEQAEAKEVDARADIYSLGIILYEMATGRVPFTGETALSVVMKQKSESPKSPKSLNPNIPGDLSVLILKCLEKDKTKRYPSAGDLRADLERIEQGLPTTERVAPDHKPHTSKEITVKFQPKKLIIPALAVVAVIAAAIVFWPKNASNLDPNLVAVAVFDNQTGDPKLDPIGREAAQSITEGLTRADLFTVAPLPSAEALQSQAKTKDPLRRIADETGAGKVVSGSYHLQGDTIRFYADIRDMNSGKILEALAPVDGPKLEPNKSLEFLRTKLMGTIACLFTPQMKIALALMREPPNFESYRETLEGMKCFFRNEYPEAIEHYSQAAVLDPKNKLALIYSGFALHNHQKYAESQSLVKEIDKSRGQLGPGEALWLDILQAWLSGNLNERHVLIKRLFPQMKGDPFWLYEVMLESNNNNYPREAVEAFRKIPPELFEEEWAKDWGSHWSVAASAYHVLGEFKGELKVARRARKEKPEILSRLWLEVRANCGLGRMKEIHRLIEESTALPSGRTYFPGSIMGWAGLELRIHGFKKESIDVLEHALQWFEGRPEKEKASADRRYNQAWVLAYLERWKEALDIFEALHKEFPEHRGYLSGCGQLAAIMGDKDKAQAISDRLAEDKTPYLFGEIPFARATIAAFLGEKEIAVALLRQAISQGYTYPNVHYSMAWERLADYPPYVRLMKPKG